MELEDFAGKKCSESRPFLSSGFAVNGCDAAPAIVGEVIKSRPCCSCCMAVVNVCGTELCSPQLYLHSGVADSLPLSISHRDTGVVSLARKPKSARGCTGVVTYALRGSGRNLQIMWSVPLAKKLWNTWLNVGVGEESASKSLLWELYSGRKGNLVIVKSDFKHVVYDGGFYAEMVVKYETSLEVVIDFNRSDTA